MSDDQGWKGRGPENPSPMGAFLERFKSIENRVSSLETSAPLQSATISAGGLTIKDGGDLTVRDGGAIRADYPDGTGAVYFGPLYTDSGGAPDGIGLHVQAPDTDPDDGVVGGPDVFRAKVFEDGVTTAVILGETGVPIGWLWGYVGYATLHAATGDVYIESDTGWGTLKGASAWIEATAGSATVKAASQGIVLDSGGQVLINSATGNVFIQHNTTSNAGNCYIGTTGIIQRSTSSLRYKQDVEDLVVDVDDVLKLRPRTWRDRREVGEDRDVETRYVGFIAEELHDAGLGQWVLYDDEGRPDAIAYDRLTAALVPVIQSQQTQLDDLRAQLDELRALVTPAPTQEA